MRYKMFRALQGVNDNEVVPALKKAASCLSVLHRDASEKLLQEANKIGNCGDTIRTVRCLDCGTNHFRSFLRCKSKYCAVCQRVKSTLWRAEMLSWLRQWREQGNYIVFCTFTLKDTDSLLEGITQLEGAWRLMTTRYRKMFLQHFPGGFKSLEIKTGENSKQWHAHLHVLFCKREKSDDTYFLKYVWPKCVAQMGGIANPPEIKALRPKKKIPQWDEHYWDMAILDSVKETCKYITEFDWMDEEPARVAELFGALKQRRQYAVWGVLSYIREAVKNAMNSKTDEDIQDFVCQVCGCTRGSPNKLYRYLWEDELIMDYKTSLPENLVPPDLLDRIKIKNGMAQANQDALKQGWIQERFGSNVIPPLHPD